MISMPQVDLLYCPCPVTLDRTISVATDIEQQHPNGNGPQNRNCINYEAFNTGPYRLEKNFREINS